MSLSKKFGSNLYTVIGYQKCPDFKRIDIGSENYNLRLWGDFQIIFPTRFYNDDDHINNNLRIWVLIHIKFLTWLYIVSNDSGVAFEEVR